MSRGDTDAARVWVEDAGLTVPYVWDKGATSLPLSDVFSGVARVAEDHHIMYDVLVMDHPDLSTFNHLTTRLAAFKVRLRLRARVRLTGRTLSWRVAGKS